jgi:hypothetical protein
VSPFRCCSQNLNPVRTRKWENSFCLCLGIRQHSKHWKKLDPPPYSHRALISRSGREGQRHFPASQFSRTQSAQSVHALITNHSRPVVRQIRPDAATTMPIPRMLLALEHPQADKLTLDSDVEFRTLVKWSENRKIRIYGRYTLNPKP